MQKILNPRSREEPPSSHIHIAETPLFHKHLKANNRNASIGSDSSNDETDLERVDARQLQVEGASVYDKQDERCKMYPQHINPVIENELVKHKIYIEDKFKES